MIRRIRCIPIKKVWSQTNVQKRSNLHLQKLELFLDMLVSVLKV